MEKMYHKLDYEYKEMIIHLTFIMNRINDLIKNYGYRLSEEELNLLNNLEIKIETGKVEIIELESEGE